MRIKPEEVAKVAQLARLSLSDEETKEFTQEFDDILEHFAVIDEYELKETPADHPHEKQLEPLRDDHPSVFEEQKKLHQNVKHMKDGFIVVPKILE